jgi:hypothetical protein
MVVNNKQDPRKTKRRVRPISRDVVLRFLLDVKADGMRNFVFLSAFRFSFLVFFVIAFLVKTRAFVASTVLQVRN